MDSATPREKPFFIASECDMCEALLVRANTNFFDEWTCPNKLCESSEGIFLDWPEEEIEKITKAAEEEGNTVPLSEVIHDLPFDSEEELKEALGVSADAEIVVAKQIFSSPKKRGDC